MVPEPKGSYVPASIIGNLLYTAGHGPVKPDGKTYAVGRVGDDLSIEEGAQAARDTALAVIATLKHTLGSLDRVKRVVKTLGMVNVNPKTINHLECVQVVNGFSDLIISAQKRHSARACVISRIIACDIACVIACVIACTCECRGGSD